MNKTIYDISLANRVIECKKQGIDYYTDPKYRKLKQKYNEILIDEIKPQKIIMQEHEDFEGFIRTLDRILTAGHREHFAKFREKVIKEIMSCFNWLNCIPGEYSEEERNQYDVELKYKTNRQLIDILIDWRYDCLLHDYTQRKIDRRNQKYSEILKEQDEFSKTTKVQENEKNN